MDNYEFAEKWLAIFGKDVDKISVIEKISASSVDKDKGSGMLIEGDQGRLYFQGTRYLGFQR